MATFGDHGHTRRGSFGLLVRDLNPEKDDHDDRLILTAAHLFKGMPDNASVTCAPPGPEPSSITGQHCGTLRRRVPLSHLPTIVVDAAVVKPHRDFECSNEMECGAPQGTNDLWTVRDATEIHVRKHGAQTGMTAGRLIPIAADHYMKDVRARYSWGWWVDGTNGTPFAARGDSGAIVIDDERRVVGMVVAIESPNEDAATFVHGINQIFSALQIALP